MRKADNLPPSCAVVTKSGNRNFLETSGPLQACNGTALPVYLPLPKSSYQVNVGTNYCVCYILERVSVLTKSSAWTSQFHGKRIIQLLSTCWAAGWMTEVSRFDSWQDERYIFLVESTQTSGPFTVLRNVYRGSSVGLKRPGCEGSYFHLVLSLIILGFTPLAPPPPVAFKCGS